MSRKVTPVGNGRFWLAAVFAVAVARVTPAEAARILAIETFAAKSHWNFMSAVLRALTDGGHSVTVFTPFPDGNRENYTEVDTSDVIPVQIGMDLTQLKRVFDNRLTLVPARMKKFRIQCDRIYSDRRLTDLLADDRDGNFDAIVIEPGPPSCLTYATAGTKLPVVYTVPTPKPFFAEFGMVGDAANPAAVSPLLARHAVPKTFAQRFSNVLLSLYLEVSNALADSATYVADPKPQDTYARVAPSIVFTNGHFVSHPSRPISPNTVSVGGVHLKPPETLPKVLVYRHCHYLLAGGSQIFFPP